ncbi:MAG: rubrerythrin family protein [Phycisphaerae bacterium]|nr:rubrerythrin family protein [Phycisphaerae bacterium]
MSTKENLKDAFAGESQANRKYLAFAKIAEKEGYPGIAKLLRAAAEGETVHAHAHLRALGELKSTAENLQEAIAGEQHEFKEMYPKYLEEALAEGDQKALNSFRNATAVEQVHASLFIEALEAIQTEKDMRTRAIYVCQVCGNVVLDSVPAACPVCGVKPEKYEEVK